MFRSVGNSAAAGAKQQHHHHHHQQQQQQLYCYCCCCCCCCYCYSSTSVTKEVTETLTGTVMRLNDQKTKPERHKSRNHRAKAMGKDFVSLTTQLDHSATVLVTVSYKLNATADKLSHLLACLSHPGYANTCQWRTRPRVIRYLKSEGAGHWHMCVVQIAGSVTALK